MTLVTFPQLIFFGFATLLLIAALLTIVLRNPVHSALSLVLAFFAAAALWILLTAEFLGLLLILVYIGAVMTLFLFVLMTLNIKADSGFVRYTPYLVFIALAVIPIGLGWWLYSAPATHQGALPLRHPPIADSSNTQALGVILYTRYVYPFEIAGVLLLVAIIAVISLSARPPRARKVFPVQDQLKVKRQDRIKLIKMEASKES